MFNFFAENSARMGAYINITGSDYNHIKNVLRMKTGERFLVSIENSSHLCELESFGDDFLTVKIVEENFQNTELPIEIHLFQGLPKADKMEQIIKQSVELGVARVIPTEMTNCVVKLEEKKKASKTVRWQTISESAAKQSKRSIVPKVEMPMTFSMALKEAENLDLILVPYECKEGMSATVDALKEIKSGMKVGVFIGPEGGFCEKEIDLCTSAGGKIISLGKRILRTETAATTAVGMCMLYAEINLGENND